MTFFPYNFPCSTPNNLKLLFPCSPFIADLRC